jgi:hypothetical protein
MAAFELLAALYFFAIAAGALVARAGWLRRIAVSASAVGAAAAVSLIASAGADALRAWAPHLYLVAGYYLPAMLVPFPSGPSRFERWLLESDRRWHSVLPTLPRALVEVTELAYLVCYPLVPASFGVIWSYGSTGDVNRFWLAVLGAGYASYASLPWLVSRPPRLLLSPADAAGPHLRALNVQVLGRVSHQLTTFPSGHVAVSAASAFVVMTVGPISGLLVGVIAAGVAVGAVAGRYHFVIDVLLGIVVAALAAAFALMA